MNAYGNCRWGRRAGMYMTKLTIRVVSPSIYLKKIDVNNNNRKCFHQTFTREESQEMNSTTKVQVLQEKRAMSCQRAYQSRSDRLA